MLNKKKAFDGPHAFLSNMHPCPVLLDGVQYPSVENAYQAAKTLSADERLTFQRLSPKEAKQHGRRITLRKDWTEMVKLQTMAELLKQKFSTDPLRAQLLDTGSLELVEYNYWHDNFWGSCTCTRCNNQGHNYLGKLLMVLRTRLQPTAEGEQNAMHLTDKEKKVLQETAHSWVPAIYALAIVQGLDPFVYMHAFRDKCLPFFEEWGIEDRPNPNPLMQKAGAELMGAAVEVLAALRDRKDPAVKRRFEPCPQCGGVEVPNHICGVCLGRGKLEV